MLLAQAALGGYRDQYWAGRICSQNHPSCPFQDRLTWEFRCIKNNVLKNMTTGQGIVCRRANQYDTAVLEISYMWEKSEQLTSSTEKRIIYGQIMCQEW